MASTDVAVFIVLEDGKDNTNEEEKEGDLCKNSCMFYWIFMTICNLSLFAFGFIGLSICPVGSFGPFVPFVFVVMCLIGILAGYRIKDGKYPEYMDRKYPEYMVAAQLIISIVGLMIYGFLLSYGVPDAMLESRNAQPICYVENALFFYLTVFIGSFFGVMIMKILWKRCLM
ncbi:hypothetical protein SNE40_011131 [Patella caerulea]|uniref:Uncharacterized protein n=1 Tax=Patella caerulea TaxID=87958 RepID=A0AAN8PVN5_PATCE